MTTQATEVELRITGMDCANCALTLEKGVAHMDGVEYVQVNFTTETLNARGTFNREALVERVHALGYGVHTGPQGSGTPQRDEVQPGGVQGFARYLMADGHTRATVIGAGLLLIGLPLAFLESIPARWGLFGLHLLVVVLAGLPILRKGVRSLLLGRQITIDLLMSIAAVGAILIGETGEAATVMVLFAIGEALEGYSADRARDSLRSLLALRPDQATVLVPNQETGLTERTVPVEQVRPGDIVLVKPGERIPVDGEIVRGTSSVNQAAVTGESLPVPRTVGEAVLAGTVNGEAVLEVRTTCLAGDSTISRIVRLVEQAQARRSPTERFIDRFARRYTPGVIAIAVLIATVPPLLFGAPFLDLPDGSRGWLYRSLAMLIVACPCALVISTPVTVVSALTGLARRGVLVKGGAFLDALADVRAFAFDKTGTLTRGAPTVARLQTPACECDENGCPACEELLAVAAAVERRSEHPLAQAILAKAQERQVVHRYAAADGVEALAGRGVTGVLNGATVTVGSHDLFHERYGDCGLHAAVTAAEARGQTVIMVAQDDTVLGFAGVADLPRQSSRAALQALKQVVPQAHMVMLTGDNPTVADIVARNVGQIDVVKAGLLPEQKMAAIGELRARYGPVAMVGDGVNDAPALAAAQVGIAMGGAGTAQAMETADVVLMQDDLTHLPDAVATSHRTRQVIGQNIAFSLLVKAIFLALALPGWTTLWMAVLADMGASLLVTLNGMRLLRGRVQ